MLDVFSFKPVNDASPALWLLSYLHSSAASPSLGDFLPPFEDYVRIFHPAREHNLHHQLTHVTDLTWAEVASRNHKVMHRQAQWYRIAGNLHNLDEYGLMHEQHGQHWIEAPVSGSLTVEAADVLVMCLSGFRGIGPCFFAVWEGFNCLPLLDTVQFGSQERKFNLFSGTLKQLGQSLCSARFQSANLCWPLDQSWCVMTEIDAMSTYVGGPKPLIDAILSSSLEAMRATAQDQLFHDPLNVPEVS